MIDENTNKELAALIAYLDVAKELVFSKEKITTFRDSLYNNWEAKNNTEFNLAKKEALKRLYPIAITSSKPIKGKD